VRRRSAKFYSYLVCLDQNHHPRFLPTMLARVTPPRAFLVNEPNRQQARLAANPSSSSSAKQNAPATAAAGGGIGGGGGAAAVTAADAAAAPDRAASRAGAGATAAAAAAAAGAAAGSGEPEEGDDSTGSASGDNDERDPRPDLSQACFELLRYVHAIEFEHGHDFDFCLEPGTGL
jgi:hypothetical protein